MERYDVAIIGGGIGGYVAAIRAAQLDQRVVLFEQERVGGLCLNWGCIPSKAILRNADVVNLVRDAERWGIALEKPSFDFGAAIDRSRKVVEQLVTGVEGLLRDNGVTVVPYAAKFVGPGQTRAGDETYHATKTIIATGASARMLPGVHADGSVIITSREALERRDPPKKPIIIGGGAVGVEFAHIWASYGSEVTVVEMLSHLLPLEDPDVSRALERSFKQRGITALSSTRVDGISVNRSGGTVSVSNKDGESKLKGDLVLVAIGFIPHTANLDLDRLGVATERGFVTIDDHMETNVPGVYAVGDVTGKLMLAHVASQQGIIAAEHAAGREVAALDYVQLPRATFTQPQVGSIGYTEPAAREAGFAVKTGRFPFTALGKAITVGETEGFVKIVADEDTGQVLGMHIIGHDVNDLLGEATMTALLEATTVELGFAVHAHPTLAEAIKEAALAVNGEAIHIARRTPGARATK